MEVKLTQPASFAVKTLKADDRRRVQVWLDHLRNWGNDEFARAQSERLPGGEALYVLKTSTDLRVIFEVRGEEILVLDVARHAALESFVPASATRPG